MSPAFEAIDRAIEFEKEGFNYFSTAMGKTGNATAKSMYEMLMDEEQKHLGYLENMKKKVEANEDWTTVPTIDIERDFKLIFKEESAKVDETVRLDTNEIEMLTHALEMEKKGRAMYLDIAEKATEDAEAALYKKLADWEQKHQDFIQEFIDYFEDNGLFTEE